MASLAAEHSVSQHRVDNVTIVHADEDVENVIRPLARILENRLKLGNCAEFAKAFRQDTDIALSIKNLLYEKLHPENRLVVVISNKFTQNCGKNKAAFEDIKNKLFSQNPVQSEFALVSPGGVPCQWSSLKCINLDIFVNEMEGGNVAEAIYKQWFGPQAKLSSQTDSSLQDLSLSSSCAVEEEYSPERVRIIHAMEHRDAREKHWGRLATAIEEEANLENTTQCRLHFRAGYSVAKTLLSDMESVVTCASTKKANAVIVWCPNMLDVLDHDEAIKRKFIEKICQDIRQQKLFTHLMFGVDATKMGSFSQQLLLFLSSHKHVGYIYASKVNAPNLDYKPFVRHFLSCWAGSISLPKSPEESSDPSIMVNSTESSLDNIVDSSLFPSVLNQFQAQQDNRGDRLVMNNTSMNQQQAHLFHQKATALGNAGTEDRLVTVNDSWNPNLAAEVRKSGASQSDGSSNPPGKWRSSYPPAQMPSGWDQGAPASAIQQPLMGSNTMPNGSSGPVSLDSALRDMPANAPSVAMSSGPPGSRCRSCGQGQLSSGRLTTQACQPTSSGSAGDGVKNRLAASGFNSHSIAGYASVPLPANHQSSGSQGTPSGASPSTSNAAPFLSEGAIGASNISRITNGESGAGSFRDPSRQGVLQHSVQTQDMGPSRLSSHADRELEEEMRTVQQEYSHCPDARRELVGENSGSVSQDPRSLNSISSSAGVSGAENGPSSITNQSVSSITNQSVSSVIDQSMSSDQNPGSQLLDKLDEEIIRQLKMRLDPLKEAVRDWRDLASHFKIDRTMINYWKGMKSPISATEQLIETLKSRNERVTIGDFMDGLKAIRRFDVHRYMNKVFKVEIS